MPNPQINPLLDALLKAFPPAGVAQSMQQSPNFNNMMRATIPPVGPIQDLGKIVIDKMHPPQQQMQPPVPMESGQQVPSQVSQPMMPQATAPTGNNFLRSLLPLLPSLAAVGVGSAFPRALAGAAGFSQGYAGGYDKQQDRNFKEEELSKTRKADEAKEANRRVPTDKEIMDQAIAAYKASRSQTMSADPDPIKSTEAIYNALKAQYVGGEGQKDLDEETAKLILQQAGGDPNKARELAKQQGYKF